MSRDDEIRAMSDERLREIQVYPDILLDLGMGWPARAILDLLTENERLRRENEDLNKDLLDCEQYHRRMP